MTNLDRVFQPWGKVKENLTLESENLTLESAVPRLDMGEESEFCPLVDKKNQWNSQSLSLLSKCCLNH